MSVAPPTPDRDAETVHRTVPPVLAGLIDDAAVFPPGNAGLSDAVAAYRRHRRAPYAELVGRFLCPASKVAELREVLEPHEDAGPLQVGVIADTGLDGLPRALADVVTDPRLVLEAVEIRLPEDVSGRPALAAAASRAVHALPAGILGYVEVPRVPAWEAAIDVIAAAGRGVKLRTGGPVPTAFPSVPEVAAVLTACADRRVALKCTAGLHHAARHRDPETGVEQHGFLNLLVAAAAARAGRDPAPALSEVDGAALAAATGRADPRVRTLFAGFGSCSIDEPVAELRALGLLG